MMGSMYSLTHGVNSSINSILLLPMLGNTPDYYIRYRDCFIDDINFIVVITRSPSNKRQFKNYCKIKQYNKYYSHDITDSFDDTYRYTYFYIPNEYKNDVAWINLWWYNYISFEYRDQIKRMFSINDNDLHKLLNLLTEERYKVC